MALVFRRFELDQGVDVPLSKRELLVSNLVKKYVSNNFYLEIVSTRKRF